MVIYTRVMFNSQGEDVALADLQAGTTGTVGTFAVPFDGKLVGVTLFWSGEQVTSLAEAVRIELTANNWKPNRLEFEMTMAGIRTAPTIFVPSVFYLVDQAVLVNQAITGQFVYAGGATPVTCNLIVLGHFTA